MNFNLSFNKKFDLLNVITLLCLILLVPAARLLPAYLGWENEFLENIQLVILSGGMIMGAVFAFRAGSRKMKGFWATVAAFFILLIGRELSWGRVFFQIASDENGPVFLPMSHIGCHALIETGIGVYIALFIAGIILTAPWKRLLSIPIPLFDAMFAVIAVVSTALSEKGLIVASHSEGMLLEELSELVVYLLAIKIICYYEKRLERQASPDL